VRTGKEDWEMRAKADVLLVQAMGKGRRFLYIYTYSCPQSRDEENEERGILMRFYKVNDQTKHSTSRRTPFTMAFHRHRPRSYKIIFPFIELTSY
jgi:hypothetical protein